MKRSSTQREADADERVVPRAPVPERLVAEAHQLHATVASLALETSFLSLPGKRRQLRKAKYAESDLLRVLGFASYEELVAAVGPSAPVPSAAAANPAPDHDDPRVRDLERALGGALNEIESLRTQLAEGQPTAPAADPAPAQVADERFEERQRQLLAVLDEIATEVEELRATVREVNEMAVATAAELIAAKLEVLVAARRAAGAAIES